MTLVIRRKLCDHISKFQIEIKGFAVDMWHGSDKQFEKYCSKTVWIRRRKNHSVVKTFKCRFKYFDFINY